MKAIRFLILVMFLSAASAFTAGKKSFEEVQKSYPRVQQAYERKERYVNERCKAYGISPENFGTMFIRVFKQEKVLEVWVQRTDKKYVRFNKFKIYASSGDLGPKRQEGDRQVPEGYYYISDFNPYSNYHLSLGINYPNESDKLLSNAARKGGNIYIHGNEVSIGCMAMSDYYIEDIYIYAVKARNQGQQRIPVQIYPFYPTPHNLAYYGNKEQYSQYKKFWSNLAQGYQFFEKSNRLPEISINTQGYYDFTAPSLAENK